MNHVYPNLMLELDKHSISLTSLAKALNLTEDDLNIRLTGEIGWSLEEVIRVCQLVNTTEVYYLFLRLDNT